MASKITIVNANAEALEVVKYRSNNSVVVPGKLGETNGSVDIDSSPVIWYNEAEQKAYYESTYGVLPGVTVTFDADTDPVGSIEVKVVDVEGVAIEGASVTYEGLETPVETTAQGIVAFTALEAGTYTFTISKTGFVSKAVSAVLAIDGSVKINVTLISSAVGSLILNISTPMGVPIEGATATIEGIDPVVSDENGIATFTDLTAGAKEIVIAKTGFVSATVVLTAATDAAGYARIILIPSNIASVAFKVVGIDNLPIEGASIACTGLDVATTSALGVAEFTGLTANTYEFTISKATFDNTVVSVVLDMGISEAYIQAVLLAS